MTDLPSAEEITGNPGTPMWLKLTDQYLLALATARNCGSCLTDEEEMGWLRRRYGWLLRTNSGIIANVV